LIGHNIKYDLNVLKNYDVDVCCEMNDTMLESYVLNNASSRHDMDSLAFKYLGEKTIKFSDVAGTGKDQKTFNQIDIEKGGMYAAEDADVTYRLHEELWPKLQKSRKLTNVCKEIDFPLLKVIAKMERVGVQVDENLLKKQSKELSRKLENIEKKVYSEAKVSFNINSPKQLQEILYEKLKLPIIKKTPKGQPSTAEAVLKELSYEYDLPKLILEYRSLAKLKSTYTDALPLQVNKKTNRVHTSFNQAVTSTGRLSSTDPNLQNIPIRTKEGRKIRKAFIVPNDYLMVSADYSQIELRILAHLSKDKGLIKAFYEDIDIHKFTASEVFDVDIKEVSDDQRRKAKAINFGLVYGMSAFGLSKQLDISKESANEYMDLYFSRYPNIRSYLDKIKEFASILLEPSQASMSIIAFFIISAAVPCIGALIAALSSASLLAKFFELISLNIILLPNNVSTYSFFLANSFILSKYDLILG
jgi:DNA polymerase-1